MGVMKFVSPLHLPFLLVKCMAGENSLTILDTSLVIIGDRVQIGTNVSIFSAGHDTSVLSRQKFVEFGHPVSSRMIAGLVGMW